jgi:hypothetical protein
MLTVCQEVKEPSAVYETVVLLMCPQSGAHPEFFLGAGEAGRLTLKLYITYVCF